MLTRHIVGHILRVEGNYIAHNKTQHSGTLMFRRPFGSNVCITNFLYTEDHRDTEGSPRHVSSYLKYTARERRYGSPQKPCNAPGEANKDADRALTGVEWRRSMHCNDLAADEPSHKKLT